MTITAMGFTSCTGNIEDTSAMPSSPEIQTTRPVPDRYFRPAKNQGRMEVVWYDSKDYAGDQQPTRKPAYVYLPYGYNDTIQYDIIYLLHGWTGVAEEFFYGHNGNDRHLVNLFDNMIANSDCRPFIAVSPTWDKDNQPKDWGESTDEAAVFYREYVGDLIPAVEGRYSTYAATTDEAGILASRNHRAIGGFSLGSITTWYIFEHAFPYSRWYLPMSGDNWHCGMYGGQYHPHETAQFLASLVEASPYKDDFYVWYAVGSNDVRLPQTHNQALAMMQYPDVFNTRTFSYHQKPGGQHDLRSVWEFCYNSLPFFFPSDGTATFVPYIRDSRIDEVVADPAFGGRGRMLFPLNSGYWSGETLGDLDLTWYSHIDPDCTVEMINYLKRRSLSGDSVFLDIYTEAEKRADPRKQNTALVFFRGRKGMPFAVCNAGGGFAYVGAMHDSFPHALQLSKRGYNAFALIYRPGAQTACEDLARAISYIFAHADELGVDTADYSLWGGSAGARMAAWVGGYGPQRFGGTVVSKPCTVVMQYTGFSDYSSGAPPTYACVGDRDGIASWRTMKSRLEGMASLGIPTEFHVYPGLQHGFGLGTGTVAEGWINDAIRFWEKQM